MQFKLYCVLKLKKQQKKKKKKKKTTTTKNNNINSAIETNKKDIY